MSAIGAVSSGMTQAMMMKPPPGPPPAPPPAVKGGADSDGDHDGSSSPNGKVVNISA